MTFNLRLIPLLPFLGAALLMLFGRKWSRDTVVHRRRAGASARPAWSSLDAFFTRAARAPGRRACTDVVDDLDRRPAICTIDLAFRMDALSGVMCLVITFIGFLIHVYSAGYMADDPDYARFFAYLNLFCGAMLVLVLGDSLPVMFIGWEGVGLCSYLLIGFWYTSTANADAGKKAFITNRIGDFGFLIGMFLLFQYTGTLSTSRRSTAPRRAGGAAACRTLWLGPAGRVLGGAVPVRRRHRQVGADPALRLAARRDGRPHAGLGADPRRHHGDRGRLHGRAHARSSTLLAPAALAIVAIVGALTALFAAIIGFAQNDFKKVLAYSTVSQLGFMFVGVGTGELRRRHLPPGHARVLQGRPVPLRRLGDARDERLGRHHDHGRPAQEAALDARRVLRLLAGDLRHPVFSGFFSKDSIIAGAFATEVYGARPRLGRPAGRRAC